MKTNGYHQLLKSKVADGFSHEKVVAFHNDCNGMDEPDKPLPWVIALPDQTHEADVLKRLDILGRKLTQEGAYVRSWAVLDAIMVIEGLTGRAPYRPGWCS